MSDTLDAAPGDERLDLFYSYAHEDEALQDELEKHLKLLEREGLIRGWDDRMIGAGAEWSGEIEQALEEAEIILLLVSANFIASDYCWDVEMRRALVRHDADEAIVVPVILRPCEWAGAPFARLQALPRDGLPIVTWSPVDEGFRDVAAGIRAATAARREAIRRRASRERAPSTRVSAGRVLDGAVAAAVPVGRVVDVVAMIRTEESDGLRGVLAMEEAFSATPQDVADEAFDMRFPIGPDGGPAPARVTLRLESADLDPPAQEKTVEVPPGGDSKTCVFLVRAVRSGPLVLNLEARLDGVSMVAQLLRTEGREQMGPREMPGYVVASTDSGRGGAPRDDMLLMAKGSVDRSDASAPPPSGELRPSAPAPAPPPPGGSGSVTPGGPEGSAGCLFVAAASGTADAWRLDYLRARRDALLASPARGLGAPLVRAYRALGAPLATTVARHGWLRALVRLALLRPLTRTVRAVDGALVVLGRARSRPRT